MFTLNNNIVKINLPGNIFYFKEVRMKNYCEIIKRRFIPVLTNIENLFSFIPENKFDKEINGYLIWKQLYHMLNSLERNFIDPNNYQYPEFHEDKLNSLDHKSDVDLNKKILYNYFQSVKEKILNYLNRLDDDKLLEEIKFKEMCLTRLDFILSQYNHVMWHLGYLYSCMKAETGQLPEYLGMYKNF
jgi:hypothetical protein